MVMKFVDALKVWRRIVSCIPDLHTIRPVLGMEFYWDMTEAAIASPYILSSQIVW